jgi:hypothetical protein
MRDEIFKVIHKWMYIRDEIPVDIIMATALAALFPGDPLWTLVIGPPGSGKTEIIRSLSGEHVYPLDTLTSKTLVSGLRDNRHPDAPSGIIQDLNGKVLVVKDLTVMLPSGTNCVRPEDNVFNQLRAAYDGEYAAAHGSGMKQQKYKSTFGMIACVTDTIDKLRATNNSLGERFISIRVSQDSMKAIVRSQDNTGREPEMREELSKCLIEALDFYQAYGKGIGIPKLDSITVPKVCALGDFVAKFRTEVDRDYRGNIVHVPALEIGTRLVKQFTRLAQMLILYEGYTYGHLVRVALDCLNPMRVKVLKAIYSCNDATPYEISEIVNIPHQMVGSMCEDLALLELCDKVTRGNAKNYSFKPEILDLILEAELL